MNKDLEKALVDGLTDIERESVKAGNSCIKFVGLKTTNGESAPSLATIYLVPGQGVYRPAAIKATLTVMSPEGLQKFALGLLEISNDYLKKSGAVSANETVNSDGENNETSIENPNTDSSNPE